LAELLNDQLKWDLVRATVQGDQSPASCSILDGRIVFSAEPIAKGAKPNLILLSQILRSGEPLPAIAREWLADLFDPAAKSEYQIKTIGRRKRGAKPVGLTNNWDAAQHALELMRWGETDADLSARGERREKWAIAVQSSADEFGITETAVEDAIKSYRDAVEANNGVR